MKKVFLFLIIGLVDVSLQAMEPEQRQLTLSQTVPVKTNDEKIFLVEPSIIAQSSVLTDCQNRGSCNEPICLPGINAKSFELILEALKGKSFEEFNSKELINLYASSDYLGIDPILKKFQPDDIDFFLSKTFTNATNFSFSTNGKNLARCYGYTGELIDSPDLSVLKRFTDATNFRFSPNGKYLAVHDDGTVKLIDLSDPDYSVLKSVTDVSFFGGFNFNPNSKYFAAGCKDGTVKLIDLSDPSVQKSFTNATNFRFSPNGKDLAIKHSDCTAKLIDLSDYSVLKSFTNASNFNFSPDSKRLAIKHCNGTVELIDLSDYSVLKSFTNASGFGFNFSPDNKYLAVEHDDGTGELIDLSDLSVLKIFTHISSFNFSPNGKCLAVKHCKCTGNGTVELIKFGVLNDFSPIEVVLLLKVFYASLENEKIHFTNEEYEIYKSFDEHVKEKLKAHIIFSSYQQVCNGINWLKQHPKTTIGLAAAGVAAAGGLYYWLKKSD